MTLITPSGAAKPVPVMDMHTDILLRVTDNGVDLANPPAWTQTTIPTMREGHVTDQVFAVWVDSGKVQGLDATNRAIQVMDNFWKQHALHNEHFDLALSEKQARAIKKQGKIAVYLWMEGGAPINNDLAMLRTFHRMGIRGMTLTWTDNLIWAGSSGDKVNPGMGLSDFGREVVTEMERLHMIVDVSHVSDQTYFDVLAMATKPVVVSHSSCRALCKHPRNVTDDMLRALAKNGGVIGINALAEFLNDDWAPEWDALAETHKDEIEELKKKFDGKTSSPDYREARRVLLQGYMKGKGLVTIDTYLDHIQHAIEVAGPEHVGLGADFDGIWAFPAGLEKASKFQSVAEGLRKRGYSEKIVRGVMGDNCRRVFAEVLNQ